MKIIAAFLLGAPVIFFVMAVCLGSIEDAACLVALSVLCTVGVSLVAWLPLCWFVGWVILKLFGLLVKVHDDAK